MDSDIAKARLKRPDLVLEGTMIRLIPFDLRHRDDPAYLKWLHDYDVIKTLHLPHYVSTPVSYAEVASYCDQLAESDTDLMLAMHRRADDAFIGTLKAGHIDWYSRIADIGVMIGDKNYWGRGLAKDAIYTLGKFLFAEITIRKIVCGSMAINATMIATFKQLGFQQEACFRDQDRFEGGFCDHIHLGCFASELRDPSLSR